MFTGIPEALARDPWVKVVEMLQQNWAVIIRRGADVLLVFYGDTCGVFDEIEFDSATEVEAALVRNGFPKHLEDPEKQELFALPEGRFHARDHPNGPIPEATPETPSGGRGRRRQGRRR